ncbi:hypothetical protein CVIRNUC_005894 [Coccomyxa viridis]|uniref:Uncharacterized protein n=1 Tax=Coccomyxa viridis TaxID=1274662 RepID=A0AAV1I5N3_9CHLO|nr:hypothetical protein CVIRNUC_005894 [Coccomyxa viridis]
MPVSRASALGWKQKLFFRAAQKVPQERRCLDSNNACDESQMSANTLAQGHQNVQQLCGQPCHEVRCMASPWNMASPWTSVAEIPIGCCAALKNHRDAYSWPNGSEHNQICTVF